MPRPISSEPSQVVLLPAQIDRLAAISSVYEGALGLSQDGSTIIIDTGSSRFCIDAHGEHIQPPNQEQLC